MLIVYYEFLQMVNTSKKKVDYLNFAFHNFWLTIYASLYTPFILMNCMLEAEWLIIN